MGDKNVAKQAEDLGDPELVTYRKQCHLWLEGKREGL